MPSLKPNATWTRCAAAFTLAEVLIGLMVLGLITTSSYYALGAANHSAMAARLQTGALTVAQSRVDQILSASPFTPQTRSFPTPEALPAPRAESPPFDLEPGTYVQTNIPIYTDPADPSIVVIGTMTTVVTDSGMEVNGGSINTYQAKVTVSYQCRNRNRAVTMDTLRASEL